MNPEAYVDGAADALGLKIAAEWKPGVLQYFQLAQAMATLLDGLPLTPADEPGNVFRPVVPETGE